MEEKQINVKPMFILSEEEMSKLVTALKKIKGFNFFVVCQSRITHTKQSSYSVE